MGQMLTTAATLLCPHGGSVSIASANARAKAGGAFIVRPTDTFLVSGCPFTIPSGPPHPCLTVEWQMPASQVTAAGGPALTTDSIGLCKAADQAVQGAVQILNTQARASAR